MLYARFDIVNAAGVGLGVGPQLCGNIARHDSGFGERFGRGELDLEPLGVFVRVTPDAAHLRPGVTWDQTSFSCAPSSSRTRRAIRSRYRHHTAGNERGRNGAGCACVFRLAKEPRTARGSPIAFTYADYKLSRGASGVE